MAIDFVTITTRGLSFALTAALATACAASAHAPAKTGQRTDILQTEQLVLRGNAEPTLTHAACATTAPSAPQHLLELRDDTAGTIRLRPAAGERALSVAMLHVTHLDSNRTWCALARPDGSPALIPGGFPGGTYAISVSAAPAGGAPRYEVVVQRL